MKIKLPSRGNTKSKSPGRRGRSSSPGSPTGKKAVPKTPRSIEKQKNMLQAKLKRAMEDNIRLRAHNKLIKETNEKYLEAFAMKDIAR